MRGITRSVANYNHMHALTIQYYEVVELYRIAVALSEAERCLFIPMKLLDFDDKVVQRYQGVLAAAALDRRSRQLLTTDFVTVRLTPTAPMRPLLSGIITAVTGLRTTVRVAPAVVAGAPEPPASPVAGTSPEVPSSPPAPTTQPSSSVPAPQVFTWNREELRRAARLTSTSVARPDWPPFFGTKHASVRADGDYRSTGPGDFCGFSCATGGTIAHYAYTNISRLEAS